MVTKTVTTISTAQGSSRKAGFRAGLPSNPSRGDDCERTQLAKEHWTRRFLKSGKKPTDREVDRDHFEASIRGYERTGDNYYAWSAIALSYRYRFPLPPELREFLQSFASDAVRVYHRKPIPDGTEEINQALASVFKLRRRRGHNPLATVRDAKRDAGIAAAVYNHWLMNQHEPWKAVFHDIGKRYRVGIPTVKKTWYAHRHEYTPAKGWPRSPTKRLK